MKRYLFLFLLFISMAAQGQSHMPKSKLMLAQNLAQLGQQAQARKLPIVLMFSAKWCEFCAILKEEVLTPMAHNPDYEGKIAYFRQISIDRDDLPLVDFQGGQTTHQAFAERFEVDLTPTVWIVDGRGNALTEPLVGLPGGSIETYSETLFARINEALTKLNHPPVKF